MTLENIFGQSCVPFSKAVFRCIYDPNKNPEDISFQKATPTGFAEFIIDNPAVADQLITGRMYYVDFNMIPLTEVETKNDVK
jgi:hypothetical protein